MSTAPLTAPLVDEEWEQLANDFPAQPALRTLKWVPKGLALRYAKVRLAAVSNCLSAEQHEPRLPDHRVQAWSDLAKLMPLLILCELCL